MRLRIKNSTTELEFEGDFDREGKVLSSVVMPLLAQSFLIGPSPQVRVATGMVPPDMARGEQKTNQKTKLQIESTTAEIAARLNVKTGNDLAVSAAAKLMFSDGKETFSRSDILTEMRSAVSFFQENYRKNLTRFINTLLKGRVLNERSKDVYALSHQATADLARKLED